MSFTQNVSKANALYRHFRHEGLILMPPAVTEVLKHYPYGCYENKRDIFGNDVYTPLAERTLIVKWFTPWSNFTWYVLEGEKQSDGDWHLYGLVEADFTELGSFSFNEITSVRGPWNNAVERDLHYDQMDWRKTVQHLKDRGVLAETL